jgi:hypothetical protein
MFTLESIAHATLVYLLKKVVCFVCYIEISQTLASPNYAFGIIGKLS